MQRGSLFFWERGVDLLLEHLVRKRVRARFGGKLRALVSGGAALQPEVGMFFLALGVQIFQGYGQTEAGPVVSVQTPEGLVPGRAKLDRVGPPLPGVRVRIAPDGEILIAGESVMQGYWRNPKATHEALQDGWLKSGDLGEQDEDGFLAIRDRKKDILVLSGGDNVSPARVEAALVAQPEIAQACVFGDHEPFLVALLVPEESLCDMPEQARISGLSKALQRAAKGLAKHEQPRRFALADEPFSLDNGLLTPTLKPKRRKVLMHYAEQVRSLYDS